MSDIYGPRPLEVENPAARTPRNEVPRRALVARWVAYAARREGLIGPEAVAVALHIAGTIGPAFHTFKPISPVAVAADLGVARRTVVQALDELESCGLLQRRTSRDPASRRVAHAFRISVPGRRQR